MKAYDLALQRHASTDSGWCFGLPPGITPSQWPLDPESGYPLQHGFTLKLPEDHRVHGPEIVALSFFATAPDHNDGGPTSTPGLADLIETPSDQPPDDATVRPFWDHARAAHPRLHRMKDILDCCYAVILLTETEFAGALCQPPDIANHPMLAQTPRPQWLDIGSAASFFGEPDLSMSDLKIEDLHTYKMLQGVPERRLDFRIPIVVTERLGDPNAGIKPVESDEDERGGYESQFTDDYKLKDWAEGLAPNHIGGTMMPIQAVPDFGPHYVEFEEYFGGYNFGTGNAQLDLKTLEFDWACG